MTTDRKFLLGNGQVAVVPLAALGAPIEEDLFHMKVRRRLEALEAEYAVLVARLENGGPFAYCEDKSGEEQVRDQEERVRLAAIIVELRQLLKE